MLDLMNARKNLMGERLEEVVEDDLILGNPGVVRRIGHHLGSFVGRILVRRDFELFRRGDNSAGDIAKEASPADGRKNLSALAREIGTRELVSRRVPEGDSRVT
jgi:hypothetical protein